MIEFGFFLWAVVRPLQGIGTAGQNPFALALPEAVLYAATGHNPPMPSKAPLQSTLTLLRIQRVVCGHLLYSRWYLKNEA